MDSLSQAEEPYKFLNEDGACLSSGDNPLSMSLDRVRVRIGSEDAPKTAPGGGLLGKLTKFAGALDQSVGSLAFEVFDTATGEVSHFERFDSKPNQSEYRIVFDRQAAYLERWFLKESSRRLLYRLVERPKRVKVTYTGVSPYCDIETRQIRWHNDGERYRYWEVPGAKVQKVKFRVVNCCRDRIGKNIKPEVWRAADGASCRLHKVAVCGSVWTCPICSRRIAIERQKQIAAAYKLVLDKGGDAMLVTFTIKHGIGDDLGEMLRRMKEADRGFMQKSRAYQRLVGSDRYGNSFGHLGRLVCTEITWGYKNGWHPHLHMLWFFDRRLEDAEIEHLRSELFSVWSPACTAAGLPEPLEFSEQDDGSMRAIGVDVRRALSADEYLVKYGSERSWSVEREMSSQHVKTARKGSRSAFQLLYDYGKGDSQAGKLFRIFAEATLGRHQLEYSKGLKKYLLANGLNDIIKSDEEISDELEGEASSLRFSLSSSLGGTGTGGGRLANSTFFSITNCARRGDTFSASARSIGLGFTDIVVTENRRNTAPAHVKVMRKRLTPAMSSAHGETGA